MRFGRPYDPSRQALKSRLRDYFEDYVSILDDDDFDLWPEFFADECTYKVISRENFDLGLPQAVIFCDGIGMIKDRVLALKETTVYEPRHMRRMLGPTRILSVDDGVIDASTSYVVFESILEREPHLFSVGQYRDKVIEVDGALKFRERLCVYDNYRIYNSLIFPI